MGLFFRDKEKKEPIEQNEEVIEEKEQDNQAEVNERPRLCSIDLGEDVIKSLTKAKYNVYNGSLGSKIKIPNISKYDSHQVLLNHRLPQNLHEYDIIIVDLDNFKTIPYVEEDHTKSQVTGDSDLALVSKYPETLFDPRPLASSILRNMIQGIGERTHLIMIFGTEDYTAKYNFIEIREDHISPQGSEEYNIYSLLNSPNLSNKRAGKETKIITRDEKLRYILEKYNNGLTYNQTFVHPKKYNGREYIKDPTVFPLITNINNEIISYCKILENYGHFIFPQITDKGPFLKDILNTFAPSIYPELFPYSTRFEWKNNQEYWLPGHGKLFKEKEEIKEQYEKALEQKQEEIKNNAEQYSFLHDLLTETGDELVSAVIDYLEWLSFDDVKDMDKIKSDSVIHLKEEDIQVELNEGLLIIEVKGIGGTSTDSDCNQVSKFKHRRCKERDSFDVFALYLVNHQRYLPPIERENPPFTEQQIEDAESDERGLLTTWKLFNLYFDIQNGILTKETARKQILNFGLINFKPKNLEFIYSPQEIYYDNYVCILELNETEIKVGDEILIEHNNRFTKSIISEIKVNDDEVEKVKNGEVGIKLEDKIYSGSTMWKRN